MRFLLTLFLFSVSLKALSSDRSRGCGAGTLLAPKKTLISTTTAETVDLITLPSRPFAMTSGTSGCAQHDLVKFEHQREHFIASNLEGLKFEAAIGQGERLAALAQSYGCPATAHGNFGNQVRQNYQATFSSTDARNISRSLFSIVAQSPELQECI